MPRSESGHLSPDRSNEGKDPGSEPGVTTNRYYYLNFLLLVRAALLLFNLQLAYYKREAPEKSRAVHIEKTTAYEKKILRGIRFKVYGSDYHIKKRQNSPEKSGYLVNGNFCRMDRLIGGMN